MMHQKIHNYNTQDVVLVNIYYFQENTEKKENHNEFEKEAREKKN